jgi:hypothetical protein
MLVQLAVGAGASICSITVHSFMMAMVTKVTRPLANIRGYSSVSPSQIMSAAVCVLMVAHLEGHDLGGRIQGRWHRPGRNRSLVLRFRELHDAD